MYWQEIYRQWQISGNYDNKVKTINYTKLSDILKLNKICLFVYKTKQKYIK